VLNAPPNSPCVLCLRISVCDLLFYAQFIASTTSYFVGFEFSSLNCQFFAFWTEFFQLAADLYFLALCVDLRVCLSNPFTNYKVNTRLYHGCALVIAYVSTACAGVVCGRIQYRDCVTNTTSGCVAVTSPQSCDGHHCRHFEG